MNSGNCLRYDWPLPGFDALLPKIFPSIALPVVRKVWVLLVCLSRTRMTYFKLLGEVFWTNLAYTALRQQKVPSWVPLWALLRGWWPSERCWGVLHRSDYLINEHAINCDFRVCNYKLPSHTCLHTGYLNESKENVFTIWFRRRREKLSFIFMIFIMFYYCLYPLTDSKLFDSFCLSLHCFSSSGYLYVINQCSCTIQLSLCWQLL